MYTFFTSVPIQKLNKFSGKVENGKEEEEIYQKLMKLKNII
jgi:hypothetical protein